MHYNNAYSRDLQIFSAGIVTGMAAFSFRPVVQEPMGEWRAAVVQQLNVLVALEKGWDGYAAGPVSFENANFALRLLDTICRPHSAPPQIVPGANGDLQLEWHLGNGDIEAHVIGPYRTQVWCAVDGRDPESFNLTNDFTKLAEILSAVEAPLVDAAAA